MTFRIWILRLALLVIGLVFIFGIYPAMLYWPSGWLWEPRQVDYEFMILGIYATLGVFLLWAVVNPLEHKSLIWFTVWSSGVHASIMLFEALIVRNEYGHLIGDIPALYLVALILGFLMPRKCRLEPPQEEVEDSTKSVY